MKNRGFTLIEMLVVISIISLLSSILLVSLNTARIKARDTRRKTDIQQLHTAINLYYDKFGVYPPLEEHDIATWGADLSTMGGFIPALTTSGFINTTIKDPNGFFYIYLSESYEPANLGKRIEYCGNSPIAKAFLFFTFEQGASSDYKINDTGFFNIICYY